MGLERTFLDAAPAALRRFEREPRPLAW